MSRDPALESLALKNDQGVRVYDPDSIKEHTALYFEGLYKAKPYDHHPYHSHVLTKMNEYLINRDYENLIWKKVEDSKIRRLFEFREEKWFSVFLLSGLGKLVNFGSQMGLRMKLIAMKELILLFQMAPSRILCDQ